PFSPPPLRTSCLTVDGPVVKLIVQSFFVFSALALSPSGRSFKKRRLAKSCHRAGLGGTGLLPKENGFHHIWGCGFFDVFGSRPDGGANVEAPQPLAGPRLLCGGPSSTARELRLDQTENEGRSERRVRPDALGTLSARGNLMASKTKMVTA